MSKIGDFIQLIDERNVDLKISNFMGLNKNKEFMSTVANIDSVDPSMYKIVREKMFVFSGMQTGRDNVIRIGLSDYKEPFLISPAYTTFYVKNIIPEYFYMIFKSSEMDRFGAFLSDSSVRANLDWTRFCDIDIEIPSIDIQKKVVNVYLALVENQKTYEQGLADLKLVCDAYIEEKRFEKPVKIGDLVIETSIKNSDFQSDFESGVSIQKEFFVTNAGASDISNQKLVKTGHFAFNSNTSRNSDTISLALNSEADRIVSNTYVTFECDTNNVNPQYLFLWFKRKEFDRYARFHSWGSARETISLNEIKEYVIALPSLEKQESIVQILSVYEKRKKINEKLKQLISEICPILIKGSLIE